MRKQYIVHEANKSLYMRRKQDWSTYYMRCWLRLLWHSQSYCHHSLPDSMLYSWGIDHNKKVAFTILEESYKLTVIFFGLTKNDILRDLVDTSSIANFIEIAIDLEVYDDIVNDVIKRIVENDLYINPERNASRKVEFLGVVCQNCKKWTLFHFILFFTFILF